MTQKLTHAEVSAKGGSAGRGAAKARTSEQARAAAQARWAKRQPKSGMPNVIISEPHQPTTNPNA